MLHIGDIEFNPYIHEHARHWALLLYQLNGPSAVIPLHNADLMSFIRVFDDTTQCQNHINSNSQKLVTLFGYDENMQPWLASNTGIANNLKYMNIFCSSDDWFFVTDWIQNYKEKFGNTVFNINTFEELNHELLSFGVKYLRELRKQFKNDFGVLNLLDQDIREICKTLGNHASQRANIEYQRIRKSEEAQN